MTETKIEIRLPDFDSMGIVHHAVYPIWYEIARLDFFEKCGFPYEQQNALGIDPVMVNLDLNYFSPITKMGTVTVQSKLLMLDGKKMRLQYECFFEDKLVNRATSFHIWTKRSSDGGFTSLTSIRLDEHMPEFYNSMLSNVEKE